MMSKQLMRKRLSLAIGKNISPFEFSWFFGAFCDKCGKQELRQVRFLSYDDAMLFSRYCGYNLFFPIPIPFLE